MKLIARPDPTKVTSFGIFWCSKARYKVHIGPERARDLFKVSYTHHFIVGNPQSTAVNLAAQSALCQYFGNLEQRWPKDSEKGLPEGQGMCQLLPILSVRSLTMPGWRSRVKPPPSSMQDSPLLEPDNKG